MTATEEIQDHQERCQPYLLRLRMLAHSEGELAPTAAEVGQATSAIVAEARAASRAALADVHSGYPGAGTFLRVRLDRLARVAERRSPRPGRVTPRGSAAACTGSRR